MFCAARRSVTAAVLTVFAMLLVGPLACTASADVVTEYHFDGNLTDSAPAGVFQDDLTGYNPLTALADATFQPGIIGQAVELGLAEGLASVVSAPDSDDLDLAGDYTVEMFVYPQPEHANHWHRLVEKWRGDMQWHFAINYPVDGLDLFMNGGNIFDGQATAPVPADTWSHVAFTGDTTGNETKIWVNGVSVGTTPYVAVVAGEGPMEIGNINLTGQEGLQYSGLIDEFTIHDTAQDTTYMESRAALLPATLTWDGSDNAWGNASHWGGPEAPTIMNPAIIPGGTVTVAADGAAGNLTVEAGGIVIDPGQSLNIFRAADFAAGTTLDLGTGATFAAGGGGSIPQLTTNGDAVISNGGTLNVGTFNDSAATGILSKQGSGNLRLINVPDGQIVAADTMFKVEQGTLSLRGDDPFAGSTAIELAGGTLSVGPGPPAVAPTLPLNDLVLHIDASEIVANEGDPIATWADLSGLGNDLTQGSPDNQPSYQSAGIGGQPVVHFDGNDFISTLTAFGNPYTIFAVTEMDGSQNARMVTSADINWLMGNWGGNQDVMYAEGWVSPDGNGPSADANPHIFEGSGTGSLSSLYNNGELIHSNAGGTSPISRLQLGAWGAGATEASIGDVAEVLIYSRTLSEAERSDAGVYLGMKYGMDTAYVPAVPMDLSAITIDVTADSTLDSLGSPTQFGPLTMSAGALSTTGSEAGMSFTSTTVAAGAQWVGFYPQVPTKWDGISEDMDGIDAANVENVTIAMGGSGTWTVSAAPRNLAASANFEVAGGTLDLRGTDTFGGRAIKITGGTLNLAGATALGDSPIELAGGRLAIGLSAGAPDAPAGGLVANWRFDDANDLGLDSVNAARSRTEIGSPAYAATGKVGGALLLDGSSQITVGSDGFDTTYSVSAWLNVDPAAAGWSIAIASWNEIGEYMHLGKDDGETFGDHGGGRTSGEPEGGLQRGTWYHVVSVRDGVENQLWIDGVMADQTSSGTPGPFGDEIYIGNKASSLPAGFPFRGMIDELYVYDRALSGEEVVSWYSSYLVSLDMSGTDLTVTADSQLDADSLVATFGNLTIADSGVLTTVGALEGINFAQTTIAAGVASAGFDTLSDTRPGPITAADTTIIKRGAADLVLDSPGNSLTNVAFDVQGGRLVGYDGATAFGPGALNLSGGELLLSAAQGASSPVLYDNPVTVESTGTVTAGQASAGAAGPMTVDLGSAGGNGVTLSDAASVTLQSTDDYSLNVAGAVNGAGEVRVDQGTVTLAEGGDIAALVVAGGSLNLGADLAVATVNLREGVVNTGTSQAIVGESVKLGVAATLSIDEGNTFTIGGPDLLNTSEIGLSGGTFTITGPAGGLGVPTDGLVARWRFEDNTDLGYDSANPDRTYSEVGAPVHTTDGKFGGALDLNGTSWLELDSTDISGIYTISAWVNLDAVDGAWHNVTGDWGNWAHLGYDASVPETFGDHGGGPTRGEPDDGPIEADRWYHLVSVRDVDAIGENQLWIDGVMVAETSTDPATDPVSGMISIGNSYVGGGGYPWIGQIDEVYIYDRGLSPDEVAELFNPAEVPAALALPETNLAVTADTTVELETSEDAVFGNLTLANGVTLTIDGPAADVNNISTTGDASILGTILLRGTLSLGDATGTLSVDGEVEMEDEAVYVCKLDDPAQGAGNDLLTATVDVFLGGTLALQPVGSLGPHGDKHLTIVSVSGDEGEIVGVFENGPSTDDHLGFGVFHQDVTYPADGFSVELDVFQAASGDTDGNRQIDNIDLQLILAANSFNQPGDWGWAQGDFDGNGDVDNRDLQLVLATGYFGTGTYSAAAPEVLEGGLVAVPEPATLGLLAAGLLVLALRRRWRKK